MQYKLNIDWDSWRFNQIVKERDTLEKKVEKLQNSIRSYKGWPTRRKNKKN